MSEIKVEIEMKALEAERPSRQAKAKERAVAYGVLAVVTLVITLILFALGYVWFTLIVGIVHLVMCGIFGWYFSKSLEGASGPWWHGGC